MYDHGIMIELLLRLNNSKGAHGNVLPAVRLLTSYSKWYRVDEVCNNRRLLGLRRYQWP